MASPRNLPDVKEVLLLLKEPTGLSQTELMFSQQKVCLDQLVRWLYLKDKALRCLFLAASKPWGKARVGGRLPRKTLATVLSVFLWAEGRETVSEAARRHGLKVPRMHDIVVWAGLHSAARKGARRTRSWLVPSEVDEVVRLAEKRRKK